MKNYEVRLTSTGRLTQLPDSQKLFGALVYMYSERYGQDFASKLTKDVLDKKIYLSLSNVMPLGYCPTPQEYIVDKLAERNDGKSSFKERRAAVKIRKYIPTTELNDILSEPEKCETIFPYIKIQSSQQQHAFIASSFYDMPELDSKLYSIPAIELLEINLDEKQEEERRSVNAFYFYFQVDDSEASSNLLDMLNEAASTKRTIILGKRASQGMNTFKFQELVASDLTPSTTSNRFLNMGMLLPDKIDFASSTLKLFTSERRPFEMPGGWNKDFVKQYISFIAEGSIITLTNGLTNAGKAIKSPFNLQRDIVFGNAFLYPLPNEWKDGRKNDKIKI